MKDSVRTLAPGTKIQQIAWFSNFDLWQQSSFWQDTRDATRSLRENPVQDVARLGSRIVAVLDVAGPTPKASTLGSLMTVASEIWNLVETMKDATDRKIRAAHPAAIARLGGYLSG